MKRIQCMIQDETYAKVKSILKECNHDWNKGVVKLQDVVEWLLSESKADIQKIRARHLIPSKIISQAKVEYVEDIDELVKSLTQLRSNLKSRKDA
jgi:hypothetical protein